MKQVLLFLSLMTLAACQEPPPPAKAPVAVETPATPASFSVRVEGNPAGRPMVLIPGLSCGGEYWNATVEHYKDRHQIHVLTLAGFAGTPAQARTDMLEAVRRDLIAYLSKLDGKAIVVGHSLGAFMAYWVAATAPEKVERVVAVDGVPFLPALMKPEATVASAKASAAPLRAKVGSREEYLANNRKTLEFMITNPKDIPIVEKESARSDAQAVAEAMYELMTTDLRDEVAKIKAPVLLFAAAGFTKDDAQRASIVARYESQIAKIPNHRIAVATKARHFVMLDDPSFFFEETDRFIVR